MSELNLSSNARRRLWKCYALLISLAEEAKENAAAESGLCEDRDSSMVAETSKETQSGNNYFQEEPEKN